MLISSVYPCYEEAPQPSGQLTAFIMARQAVRCFLSDRLVFRAAPVLVA